ncbi:hypothetical protein FRC12_020426 [Ceratobasidium sp. 428]|nr:hypothetical protein FRC12_020426 [Ceratobasidium sp. 428]
MSRISNRSDVFKDMLELPSGVDGAEGTSDINPVILPQVQVTPDEFRNLLYLFYESPLSPGFVTFISGALGNESQWPNVFKRYLDIAKLARRFCMAETEEWAQEQLREITGSLSPPVDWMTHTDALSALSYFKLCDADSSDDEHIRKVRNLAYFAIHHSSREVLLELYKSPPAEIDRALSGFVFVRMLSAGHKSPTWARLSWVERATLYAGQVHLTPLPTSFPFCDLASADSIISVVEEDSANIEVCSKTTEILKEVWEIASISWNSSLPLEGVISIRNILWARRKLEIQLKSALCLCKRSFCHDPLLARLDGLIEILFVELARLRDRLSDQ